MPLGSDPAFRAKIGNFALGAVGFAGGAAAAAVPDQEMGKEGPVRLGYDFHQRLFHLHGVMLAGQSHPAAQTAHVGVHDDALGQVEGVAQNHVGGFSAHAREFVEMFHGTRHFTIVVFNQGSGTATDRFGLGAEKSCGADQALQLSCRDLSEVMSRSAAGKEGGSDFIDPLVGALGGENCGDEKL